MKTMRISSIVGIILGCIIGYFISQTVLDDYKSCEQLKQENKLLRKIIFEQNKRYYSTQ
jgi:uncharacterized protein YneF (UPF0154 family)